ncbi:semaphorin-4B [Sceloporus undulatus]|uniref:semaphorin-4B n=1 Tax=Sceloporus undulatus TaxID=8520 RepID=UPI001C4C56BE|nr:semaphorin-4B [Sceloporus undulatus]
MLAEVSFWDTKGSNWGKASSEEGSGEKKGAPKGWLVLGAKQGRPWSALGWETAHEPRRLCFRGRRSGQRNPRKERPAQMESGRIALGSLLPPPKGPQRGEREGGGPRETSFLLLRQVRTCHSPPSRKERKKEEEEARRPARPPAPSREEAGGGREAAIPAPLPIPAGCLLPSPRRRRQRGPRKAAMAPAALLLLLLLEGAWRGAALPRISLPFDSPQRLLSRFEAPRITNYTTLMLSPDGRVLYAGARETLLALNTSAFSPGPQHRRLSWGAEEEKKRQCVFKGKDPQRDCHNYIKILLQLNETHLYTCGTSAFSPTCTYIKIPDFSLIQEASGKLLLEDGKGRCPFDPEYKSTAIMVEGELYTGTVSNFQGNEPTILRSHGSRPAIKTENSLNWLQDPFFVGSAYLREGLPPSNPQREEDSSNDNDKIYFFFSESGKEFDFFDDTIVSRIARVCKVATWGGERVLQRRWTTFLKAPLLCSHPEDGFPFNILQDMFVLTPGQDWRQTVFYGVFTSQWDRKGAGGAAVCAFSMLDVKEAFNGLYKEVNRETQQWYTDTHPVPEPRPGACISSQTRQMKIASSLQMPDRVLNYLKDHFLMDSAVRSQPLLLQGHSRYRQLSVQRVQGLHQAYDVLFLGTDNGQLHKAVVTGEKVHLIEEIQLFPPGQPILELLLDPIQGLLYAASYDALVQVPLANCSLHQTCGECILAQDPYCAWSGHACQPPILNRQQLHGVSWAQDIENADAVGLCPVSTMQFANSGAEESPCQRVVLHPNAVKPLPCPPLSNLASWKWEKDGAPLNASSLVLPDGGLVLVGGSGQAGRYECWSWEGGFRKRTASYCVEVEPALGPRLMPPLRSPPETVSTSRSTSAEATGDISALLEDKTYWTEFLVMCALFGMTVTLLTLFGLHRHHDAIKAFLKQGTCTHAKAPRKAGAPPESLPLNSANVPSSLPEHKGYQALNDSHVANTPAHVGPGHLDVAFLESSRRPLSIHGSFVEVSAASQRPRVRLGSEIRDSVV